MKFRFRLTESAEMSNEYDNEGNRLTVQQVEFFKNSKVRDKQGRLLVCYHGTNAKFDRFDKSKFIDGSFGRGFYFTANESEALEYGSNVIASYVNIANPYYIGNTDDDKKLIDYLEKSGVGFDVDDALEASKYGNIIEYFDFEPFVTDAIEKLGYDGIQPFSDMFVAFSPNQIKSITNKTPTNSDNINEGVWQHKINSYIDYKGDKVVGEYDEYEPQKDSKYKRLCQKPINTLTLDEIVYLFAIHQCIYMREFQPSLEDTLAQVEEEHMEDLEKCYDFVHSLKFPLTIYRTIREEEKDFNIGGKQRSYSWTTNINIYKNERSMFRNAVNIIAGEIEPNIIDNANTISNFVYYTARPSYGRFGEYEITLKKNFKSSDIANLRVVNKDDINERLNNINESLMMKSGMYVFDTASSLMNFLRNQRKDIRILYDANLDKYFACDGNEYIHWDMIKQADREGYYYKLEDFIDEIGTIDNYVDYGVNGGYVGEDGEDFEYIDPYLYYIIFSPDNSFEVGIDDYDKEYNTSIGRFLTRDCDIEEIDLYDYIKRERK